MAIQKQEEQYEINWMLIAIIAIAIVIAVVVGLYFMGVFDGISEQKPVIEKPKDTTSLPENPRFETSKTEGLLPSTPQLNIPETTDTGSLSPTTPQAPTVQIVQTGNMDDVKPAYRNHLESLPIADILLIQDYSCSSLSDLDYPATHDRIINQRSNEC